MSGPGVSVLTAALRPDPAFLWQAYASLREQAGVDWEWVLQLDGPDDDLRELPAGILADPAVHVRANGERLGVAATRNLALLRCRYELVQNLDADDLLAPDALACLSCALEQEGVAFAFGCSHLFTEQGTVEHWQPAPWPPGVLEPGVVGSRWLATGRHHVSLNGTMWKRIYVEAYGGWGALRGMQDVHLALAVSEDHAVAYVDRPTVFSRVHTGQNTRQEWLTGERETRHREWCARRILAARRLKDGAKDPSPVGYLDPRDGIQRSLSASSLR